MKLTLAFLSSHFPTQPKKSGQSFKYFLESKSLTLMKARNRCKGAANQENDNKKKEKKEGECILMHNLFQYVLAFYFIVVKKYVWILVKHYLQWVLNINQKLPNIRP